MRSARPDQRAILGLDSGFTWRSWPGSPPCVPLPELNRITAGAHSICFRQAGAGPRVVFLHGFLCHSACWRTQLEGLSDEFSVIAWDAPGAGASSDPPEAFTIA